MLLTKGSSARTLILLLLALCCLTNAFGAKITSKAKATAEKNKNQNNATAAGAEVDKSDENAADDDDSDEADDDDEAEGEPTDDSTKTAEKNALQPANGLSSLSVWGMVSGLWNWLRADLSESIFGVDDTTAVGEGRTFGKIRRLQMALIPIVFKFGVLSAMVTFLVVIGMKSLFLLKVLVVMNAIAILGKFLTLKTGLGQIEHSAPSFNYNGWNPHVRESWVATAPAASAPAHPSKEIHLHIHGAALAQHQGSGAYNYDTHGWQSRSDPYVGSTAPTQQQEEQQNSLLHNTDPFSFLPTKYTARHLTY